MKKFSKVKKVICITILCIFLAFLLCILFLWRLGIWPWTQRWFISYNSFRQWTGGVAVPYPEELPSSAEDIKYFYYTGWFDIQTGISFTVSDEDYHKLKESLELSFFTDHSGDLPFDEDYMLDGKVTPDFLEEEGIEYLGEVFLDTPAHYKILVYQGDVKGGQSCFLQGIFYNDDTNEIVMFGFKDAFRKSRQ